MVIQLPEWKNWRIEGNDRDWQVQRLIDGKNGEEWKNTNFFPSLHYAIAFAYEKALRKSPTKAETVDAMYAECRRVKDELVAAVREAVG